VQRLSCTTVEVLHLIVLVPVFLNRTDPDQDYGYYDLTKDAEHILAGSNRRAKNTFDRVKYWPPKSLKKKLMRKPTTERRVSSVFNAGGSVSGIQ